MTIQNTVLENLFPEGDYRLQMRFRKGEINDFFANTGEHKLLTAERKKWISSNPNLYVACDERALPALTQAIKIAFPESAPLLAAPMSPFELCRSLAERVEPDFLLLVAAYGSLELAGGSVCFPSSWSFEEKMGHSVGFIHTPVPSLNSALGQQIDSFLRKIPPGISWERTNWGLSRSPELNQHPVRNLEKLDSTVAPNEIFLRVEWQSLVALEQGNVLFGIRLIIIPLCELTAEQRQGLGRSLASMPDEIAAYKNILNARPRILQLLEY